MKRNVLLLVVLAVASVAMVANGWPSQGEITNFPGLMWGWDSASGTARPACSDSNGLIQMTIASGTVNAMASFDFGGTASRASLDAAGRAKVNVSSWTAGQIDVNLAAAGTNVPVYTALQAASLTVRTMSANTEVTCTNITNQTMISIQNQGVGDLWVKMNASATVSSGLKLVADSMFEIRMKSTDAISMISSTTPVVVVVKQ